MMTQSTTTVKLLHVEKFEIYKKNIKTNANEDMTITRVQHSDTTSPFGRRTENKN